MKFKQRVEAIADALVDLQEDLDGERRAMTARWTRREKILERGRNGLASLVGEVHGIAGGRLPSVKHLELEAPNGVADGAASAPRRLPARAAVPRGPRRPRRGSR